MHIIKTNYGLLKNTSGFIALVAIIILCSGLSVIAQAPKLKFSDLNFGIDCHLSSNQDSANPVRYHNQAIGFSGRYQTSVVANHIRQGKTKRFEIADMIAGEMAFGAFQSNNPAYKTPLWFNFRFDLGVGTLFRINENQDVGLNWIIMRFANDYQSTYFSGSELQARYRYKKCSIELGTANRNVRGSGFTETYLKKRGEGNVTSMGFRYLVNDKRNFGVRLETFNLGEMAFTDKIINCRIFYGYYF